MVAKNILIIVFIIHSTCALAMHHETMDAITMPIYLCPFAGTAGEQINLVVHIPEHFRAINSHEACSHRTFIAQTDKDTEHCTEFITTHSYQGRAIPAPSLVLSIKEDLCIKTTDARVLEIKTTFREKYYTAFLKISYTCQGRRKLLYASYFSGPTDCAGIQYHIDLSSMREADAQEKLDAFFKDHVEINCIPTKIVFTRIKP